MRNYRILVGFMVVFFVAFLSLSAAAHARREDDDDSGSGHKKNMKGKKFQVLQAQIDVNKAAIENIELTPGPAGADGADGQDGLSIQGPQGEPGTSSWIDGFGTVSTTGSVQIGNDTAGCTSANEGTIRYNTTSKTLELCNGSEWLSLSVAGSGSGSGTDPDPTPDPGAFACGTDQVQDADGNLYNTVLIGTQCWMAENLNVGTMVAATSEQTNNSVIEKYCFNDDSNICATDGGFYQWNEMMQYSTTEGARGICPTGWHLPTDTEWKTLEMALGMTQAQAESTGLRNGSGNSTQTGRHVRLSGPASGVPPYNSFVHQSRQGDDLLVIYGGRSGCVGPKTVFGFCERRSEYRR